MLAQNPIAGAKPPPERQSKAPEFYSQLELTKLYTLERVNGG